MSETKIPGLEFTDYASFKSREEMIAFARGILAVDDTKICVTGFEYCPNTTTYYCFFHNHYEYSENEYDGKIGDNPTIPLTVESEELTK